MKLSLFVAAVVWCCVLKSAQATGQCVSCENCAVCSGIEYYSNGYWKVSINLNGCKNNSTISWICCKDAYPGGSCQLIECNNPDVGLWEVDKAKCNEVTDISFSVLSGTESITLQLHDGKFLGTVDPSDPPSPLCGGSGSSCSSSPSGVCQVVVQLSTCANIETPECLTDSDCSHLSSSCASGMCDHAGVGGGVCKQVIYPSGVVCRPAADLCDVPETCSGVSPDCPSDIRKDHAYTYKCGLDQFLCAVTKSELTIKNTNTNTYFLGTCGIGVGSGQFYDLPWPQCTTQCINNLCPNNRQLSNYALAVCDPLTGQWNCTQKTDMTFATTIPICPYNGP